MNNAAIQIKFKQRLNKLASNDYDNIEAWQIIEAFNKGSVEWCRRQLHGFNLVKEASEQSVRRIDDLEILMKDTNLTGLHNDIAFSAPKPADYFQWKRVSADAISDCCKNPRMMKIFQVEEANIDDILRDVNKRPNFEWAETVATLKGGNILIYTLGQFTISNAKLVYYRQPRKIQIAGVVDPYTGVASTTDVESEFKDDIIELMIDEAAKIAAGDIENFNQKNRLDESVEKNN